MNMHLHKDAAYQSMTPKSSVSLRPLSVAGFVWSCDGTCKASRKEIDRRPHCALNFLTGSSQCSRASYAAYSAISFGEFI